MKKQERSAKVKIIFSNTLAYISAVCLGIMLMPFMDAIEKPDNIEQVIFYALTGGICFVATMAAIIRTLRPLWEVEK